MKKYVELVLIMLLCITIVGGCGEIEEIDEPKSETQQESQTEEVVEEVESETKSSENDISKSDKYQIGDTVNLSNDSGKKFSVTISDWGTEYDRYNNIIMYVSYEIENTGEEKIDVGNYLFNIYADDYSVEQSYLSTSNMNIVSAELSSGRKVSGRIYGKINPGEVQNIDVEIGNVVFAIQGEDAEEYIDYIEETQQPETQEMTDGRKELYIPDDLLADEEQIPYSIAGYYSGVLGQSYLDINMDSSAEDGNIGTIDAYVEGGEYSYSGTMMQMGTNIYLIQGTGNDIVLVSFYTEMYDDQPLINAQLFVNGSIVEGYIQINTYES